jgi:hypothetical protein
LKGELPDDLRRDAALYAGCIAGALQKEEYLGVIERAGFTNLSVQKDRKIEVPEEILRRHLTSDQLREFNHQHIGIFSVTVFAKKPGH